MALPCPLSPETVAGTTERGRTPSGLDGGKGEELVTAKDGGIGSLKEGTEAQGLAIKRSGKRPSVMHRFRPEPLHRVETSGKGSPSGHIDTSRFVTHRCKEQDYWGSPSFLSFGAMTIWQ